MSNNDTAQIGLKEPEQTDWNSAYNSSKYQAPPPAIGPDGKPIIYRGVVGKVETTSPDQGYLNILLDPIKIVKSGSFDGQEIRFTRVSTRPFMRRNNDTGELEPLKGNPNALGKFLRGAGLSAKPQTNAEYMAAAKMVSGKEVAFTIDWEAYNKDTGERIRGYASFPDDPERPGQKKSILKRGDVIVLRDGQGNVTETKKVESEVLFANARLKYFQDVKGGGR